MNSNPILKELWKIKDDLAREAGYDADRFVENLRRWETENLPNGPIVRPTAASREVNEDAVSSVLREEPPKPGDTHA